MKKERNNEIKQRKEKYIKRSQLQKQNKTNKKKNAKQKPTIASRETEAPPPTEMMENSTKKSEIRKRKMLCFLTDPKQEEK